MDSGPTFIHLYTQNWYLESLFDLFDIRLTYSCQAMLPQNPGGHACFYSKCDFCFAWFITAKCPLCISMSAVTLKRMAGFKLAATMFARSTCLSFGLFDGASATSASAVLAICVARQFEASLNKLDPTCNVYCEQRLKCELRNSSWNRRAMADFVANQWVKDKTDDFKDLILVHELLRSCRMVSHLFAMPAMVSFLLKHVSEVGNPNKRENKDS